MPPGYMMIAVHDCNNFPGWDNLYLTPDYIDAGWTTPSGDGQGIRMVAVGNIQGDGCNNAESLITPVDVEPNKHYILVYDRAGYYPSGFVTGPPGGTATPPLPICDDCGVSQNVLFATEMDRFLVRLTNEADISWDYTTTLYCDAQANSPDQYTTITPSGLDATTNAYTEANIPGDITSGIQWKKIAMCFSTGANESWDRLYVHPLQLGNHSYIIALLDRLRLIEDDFPSLQTNYEICDGESVEIGSSFCTDDAPDFVFAWEVFNGTTWNVIPGETDPTINVEPSSTTTYRLTRTLLADPGTPLENYYGCADASVEITVNIVENTECCIQQTVGNYETIPATIGSGTWSYGVGNNPWNATGPVRLNGDMVIASGVNLTINNMVFEMGPLGRIIVQQGGILNLNSCDLHGDSVCETMWQGIQVHGPGLTAPFNSANTGKLYLSNVGILDAIIGVATMNVPLWDFATINLAIQNNYHDFVTAISVSLFELWNPTVYDLAGGFVDIDPNAAPTKFEDCLIGINISYRAGVDLIENAFFNDNGGPLYYPYENVPEMETGVYTIIATPGYTIRDCTFWDCRWGIRANETQRMTVRDSEFERCRVGISSRNYIDFITQTTNIYDNTFEKCWVSVQLDANNAAFVKDNQINQLTDISYYNDPNNYSLGTYMRGSDFDLRNNFVKDVQGGLVFTDCDQNGAIAGGNEIREADFGVYSHGDNTGVELWCNHIIDYGFTGLLIAENAGVVSGTLGQQGLCDLSTQEPAANTLVGASGSLVDIFFSLNTNDLIYHDVNASSLTWTTIGFGMPGSLLPTNCSFTGDLSTYCEGLGYPPPFRNFPFEQRHRKKQGTDDMAAEIFGGGGLRLRHCAC